MQPQLGRRSPHLERFPPDQRAGTSTATKTAASLPGAAGSRSATVNQPPKSVVREIRTPRSVGTGGGRPPPVTRWARSNARPYRDQGSALRRDSSVAIDPTDGVIGRPNLWIAEDFGCCASG